ncbi:MAG TPA: HEAT repeat domain-containing protein [Terriglobales bacterium]|nr:HEAT repeat domain-containing protein [Terriglobales bacterium]
MLDKKQLKVQGLRYARSLQVVVRTVVMLSLDHKVAAGPLQASFDSLNHLLKETGRFTLGFVENRIMLNNLLTTDAGLVQLENEFLKRGYGAVTFEPGLTLSRYKAAISVLSANSKVIAEAGGAKKYLDMNPLEGVRVFPAGKNQARTDSGDTILETEAEAFLASKQREEMALGGGGGYAGLDALTMLLESACMERSEALGVGGPSDIMKLIGPTVEAALVDRRGDPEKSCMALARILQEVSPDMVMGSFPAHKQAELKDAPPEQVASEFVEDTAIQWAVQKLATAPTGPEAMIVEEDVVRVLVRSLQATRMANRMASKLATFVKEHVFPPTTYQKIQDELKWVALPTSQKHADLMAVKRFTVVEFRRLIEHLRDLLKEKENDKATELAKHYFDSLDGPELYPDELSRGPELINLMSRVRTDFAVSTAQRLSRALLRDDVNQFVHFQLANSLVILSKNLATYEEFDTIVEIGTAMEKSLTRDPGLHVKCCSNGLAALLPPAAVERTVELLMQKKDDPAWTKTAMLLVRWSGTPAIQKLFSMLEKEQVATNRMALLRFIAQTGSVAVETARRQLSHERWYVVRNACKLLGELKDAELLSHLTPVLQHPDERVQQAALTALNKNRVEGRGQVIAENLATFGPHVQEQVLEELLYLRDPATLTALAQFVFVDGRGKLTAAQKAVQAIAANPAEQSVELLANVLCEAELEPALRRTALNALRNHQSEAAQQLLADFVARFPNDPLATDVQRSVRTAAS